MSLYAFAKGWFGETMGAVAHWALLDKNIYHSINNITLVDANGTTQIDHVIVSRYGIFVIEAKNIDGWIFGDAKSPKWTIVRNRRKFQIQNPLHQNYRHVKAVVEFLDIEEAKVHSLVMFWGECEFKTSMPSNVILTGYTSYIKNFHEQLISDKEVVEAVDALRTGALPKTWETHKMHIASLQKRHASKTVCAKCGSALVLRTARNGANAGSKFYGCTAYPKCRHTVPFEDDDRS